MSFTSFLSFYFLQEQINYLLTTWDDVEKQNEVIKFSCIHSIEPVAVVKRICKLLINKTLMCLRTPSHLLRHRLFEILQDLVKQRTSWNTSPVCNKVLNIVSEVPLSMVSQFYIMCPQLCNIRKMEDIDRKSGNTNSSEEMPTACVVFTDWSQSPSNIRNALTLLENVNQNITDLYVDGLNLCRTVTNKQEANIKMDRQAESCNLVYCKFPAGIQRNLGNQLIGCDKLKVLNIPDMQCMAKEIVPHISRFTVLTGLNLANCKISEDQSSKLCDGLQFIQHLRVLDLSCNHLGAKGAGNLAKSINRWSNVPPLENIYLKGCHMDSTGCVSVMEALVSCKKLYGVVISENLIGGALQTL